LLRTSLEETLRQAPVRHSAGVRTTVAMSA